jgi:carbamoyltransferase
VLDHHYAHACATFLPSPFESAAIVIADRESPHVSVWEGKGVSVTRVEWPWRGPGFAEVYSQCADALGFRGAEQRMEALARLNANVNAGWAAALFTLREDGIEFAPDWRGDVAKACGSGTLGEQSRAAAALQARIGELLVEFLARVRHRVRDARVCLGGGLFYNSHLNTQARLSGVFDDVFVPMDPGNSGVAVGAALHAGGLPRQPISPFLGPSYTPNDVKAVLDNCKLTYRWVSETEAIANAVDALRKGQLVGWFDGPMESGPRALGARSILANPFSKYVLDNLNQFLKHRDPWRGYALSGLPEWVTEHFAGPATSPFMECDFVPKEADRFRHVLPGCEAAVRVQTVGPDAPPRFQALLRAFRDAAGGPVLVNTSFNGFREPIVCSPRDAIRVFYGSGIDMLVFGQFILSK